MAAALYLPPSRRPRLRFTIGGLFACTFIVGVGLARWRLPGATLLAALLASLSAWLLVGLAKSLMAAWRDATQFGQMPRQAQWSVAFDFGASLAGIAFGLAIIGTGLVRWRPYSLNNANELLASFGPWLAFGVLQRAAYGIGQLGLTRLMPRAARGGLIVEVAARLGIAVLLGAAGYVALTSGIALPRDWYETWGISVLAFTAFFLAVVCAYWPEELLPYASSNQQIHRRVVTRILLVVGAFWIAIVVLNPGVLTAFVHITLHEVQDFEPTRWLARDLSPFTPALRISEHYATGAIVAATLFLVATVANLTMIARWDRPRARYVLMFVSLVSFVAVIGLLAWFRFQLLPDLSPLLAAGVAEQKLEAFPLAGLLAIAVATAFAWWYTASPQPDDDRCAAFGLPQKQFLHEHPTVMAVGLAGALSAVVSDVSVSHWGLWGWTAMSYYPGYGSLTDYLLEQPFKLIVVAAALVLAKRLWAWWCAYACPSQDIRLVQPARFAAAWLAALVTVVLLAPLAAWGGSALLLKFLIA